MAEKFLMKNESTGQIKPTFLGYSWTMLIFNGFAPLFRGDFLSFLILFGINILVIFLSPNILFYWIINGLPAFIFSFIWNKFYTNRLIKKGFIFADSEEKNAYAQILLNKSNTTGIVICAVISTILVLAAIGISEKYDNEFDSWLEQMDFSDDKSENNLDTALNNEEISKLAQQPLKFDHCKLVDGVLPLICGDIPFKGYKRGECISAFMEDFDQACKRMKKGKKYYFEYKIFSEDSQGDPCDPYENITKIYFK